jgi:hypothetical protein
MTQARASARTLTVTRIPKENTWATMNPAIIFYSDKSGPGNSSIKDLTKGGAVTPRSSRRRGLHRVVGY